MRPRQFGALELDAFEHLGPGVTAVSTTRHGGVSAAPYDSLNLGDHVGDDPAAVRANRDRVAAALGVEALTIAEQCHHARVAVVRDDLAGVGHAGDVESKQHLADTDALVTDRPGAGLVILVADCQPIVFWDPVHRALGVAHAGRAGTIAGVVPATIAAMAVTFGTVPGDLRVGIGPHIGADSYEVGPTEAASVAEAFGHLDACRPSTGDRWLLDLAAITRWQLAEAGVDPDNVEHADIDTLRSTDRYFSDRAARPCGRFALVATIEPR